MPEPIVRYLLVLLRLRPPQGSQLPFAWTGKHSRVLDKKPGSDRSASSQCQVTVLTEPSPPPQPPPTSGSEQIGFLKTINCSCPPGEKVHSPPSAAGLGSQCSVGPELTELAVELGISHHARGLPGQDDPGLQVALRSGDYPCSWDFFWISVGLGRGAPQTPLG